MRFIALLLLILVSCQQPETTRLSGIAMTMPYSIIVDEKGNGADQVIQETFHKVDRIYNKWNPASELSRLNQLEAYTQIEISSELAALLHLTGEVHHLSDGRFDPTIEPLQALWKAYLEKGELPPKSEVKTVQRFVGWDRVHLEGRLFWKEQNETALDLSGIAKGLAVDLLVENLQAAGYENVFVEWGGEVRAAGNHPTGRPWMVGIRFREGAVPLEGQALATSGNYFQFWEVDGKAFTHILDPRTGVPLTYPAGDTATTSVRAPTCALADAVATVALMCRTPEELAWWKKQVAPLHVSLD